MALETITPGAGWPAKALSICCALSYGGRGGFEAQFGIDRGFLITPRRGADFAQRFHSKSSSRDDFLHFASGFAASKCWGTIALSREDHELTPCDARRESVDDAPVSETQAVR